MAETHPPAVESFLAKINSREAQVGIIGMGYVGLPLALTFIEKGFRVLGFDVDPAKVTALSEGRATSSTSIPRASRRQPRRADWTATADFSRLGEPDAILICVPTPLTRPAASPT